MHYLNVVGNEVILFFIIACCWPCYTKHREIQENLKMFHFIKPPSPVSDIGSENEETKNKETRDLDLSKLRKLMNVVWEVLDEPYSSNAAKVGSATIFYIDVLTMNRYNCDFIHSPFRILISKSSKFFRVKI